MRMSRAADCFSDRCARTVGFGTASGTMKPLKKRLLTPGPTTVPEETLLEMAKPVFYHRSPEFRQLLAEVTEGLQYVFCTKNPVITLTCSGTGGLEAALVNCVPPGGKVI